MMTRVYQLLCRIESAIAIGSLLALLLIALGQIIARNLFDSGLIEADVLARHLVLYIVFFGSILAIRRNAHIRIDLLAHWIPPHNQVRATRLLNLFATGICAVLTYAAIKFWLTERIYTPDHEMWVLFVSLVIPIGFCLMTLRYAIQVWRPVEKQAEDTHAC
ncbi:MAG TPA: TRAP transporter small permease [Chromatiaceae bacterium]|jgi:TRAP-type C4-dicarboxylate transport system permease small subunit|nr:TRAP transporter small permease [Chromatiaceae bacterium]HIN82456.1 TRAP transporter small permease [Chromatiales bacterium]HIO53843.1 TRAP transporter small permease [Chromatiales bacterium]